MRFHQLSLLAVSSLMLNCNALAGTVPDGAKVSAVSGKECHVSCVDPHPCCEESKKVLEILQKLVTAYSHGDIKTYEQYLDDHCSMFNEETKKLITGKADVLAELQQSFREYAPGGSTPLVSFTIDQPYAKLTGPDTCVVTFVATKQVGGEHPCVQRANITDVFVKRGDDWRKLHWRGRWETVSK